MTTKKKMLVLGEQGNFGRRISAALSRSPGIECIIGLDETRRNARLARERGGAVVIVPNDPSSVRRALDGVFAAVNIRGPFLDGDCTVAEQCAELGVHYVDPADSRIHAKGLSRLASKAQRSGSLIVTGAVSAPAVSALLVEMLAPEFDSIRAIHVCLAPGKNDCRELATARAILGYSTHPQRMKAKGRWRQFENWTQPQPVEFPAPVGRRHGYLCDMPDLEIFPKRYGARTVTFRTALSSLTANLLLSSCRWFIRRDVAQNLPSPADALLRAIGAIPGVGSSNGGLAVEVRGIRKGKRLAHSVFLIARDGNGSAIAAAPSIALVKKWVREGVAAAGVTPCVGLLNWADVRNELLDYDIVLVRA